MSARTRQVIFGLTVIAHLAALYAPKAGAASPVVGIDKVAHLVLFGGVLAVGAWAGVAVRPLALALLVNAVLSELAQYLWLARRSGDVWDAVADALGVLVVWLVLRRRRPPPGPPDPDSEANATRSAARDAA